MPDQPTIAGVVSNLLFATKIEDAARAQGCVVIWPIDQAAFEAALRAGARLAIIDAGTPDRPWLDWVRAAKSDPVMQQVPIIAFGAHVDSALRKAALAAGVDRYLARANFVDDLPEIAAFAARDKTDDPCSEPLPAGAIHGLEEFNAAKYFEQHETLELVWRAELRPIRDLYRGILQIGVACLQIERGNARGALKMIDRATRWLQPFRPKCQGVEVDRLLADAVRLRSELERLGSKPLDKLDRSLFPKVHYQSQA
jgi:predicted metal-dependent hydrolase